MRDKLDDMLGVTVGVAVLVSTKEVVCVAERLIVAVPLLVKDEVEVIVPLPLGLVVCVCVAVAAVLPERDWLDESCWLVVCVCDTVAKELPVLDAVCEPVALRV